MTPGVRGCLLLLAALVDAPRAALAADGDGLSDYYVQPGDSCWSIAERLFGSGERYDLIHRHNDLGPMPHLLVPGQRLRVPADVNQPTARVRVPENDVRSRPPTAIDWTRARDNTPLWRLFRVATGDASSAEIRFLDESSLVMRQDALLVIHGASAAAARLHRDVKTTVVLEKGTVRGGLARLDAAADLSVSTPAAEVDLLATLAQVAVDEEVATQVCVYEGRASVSAQGVTVRVPSRSGTAVAMGHAPLPPRPLLPAPRWARDDERALVVVPRGYVATFEAAWHEVAGAGRYRVELTRDAAFRQIVVDATVGAGITRFRAEDLAAGEYWARVSAVDDVRLEGEASRALHLSVVTVDASQRLERASDGIFEAVGLVRLGAPSAVAPEAERSVDGGPFAPADEPVRFAGVGDHEVRYRARGGVETSRLALRLLKVSTQVVPPDEPLVAGGAAARVCVRVVDEQGRPVALPGTEVVAGDAPGVQVRPGAAGEGFAEVAAPPTAAGSLAVQVLWSGGELARADLPVSAAPARWFAWPLGPVAAEWSGTPAGLPATTGTAVSRLGVSVGFARPTLPTGEVSAVRSTLHGEVALLGGRLGLGADLPWLDVAASGSWANRPRLGDARLSVRGVAWQGSGLSLAPSLAVALPTSRRAQAPDRTLLEPALTLEGTPGAAWRLGTRQAVAFEVGLPGRDVVSWALTGWAAWQAASWLQVSAEASGLLGLRGSSARAVFAGGAVRVPLDRARLGLTCAGALNDDARAVAGRVTTGLSVDLGFEGP
jgi:hypothetical protein